MITRIAVIILALGQLASCGNVSGKPLPEVDKDAPTWALVPDHLNGGILPK